MIRYFKANSNFVFTTVSGQTVSMTTNQKAQFINPIIYNEITPTQIVMTQRDYIILYEYPDLYQKQYEWKESKYIGYFSPYTPT